MVNISTDMWEKEISETRELKQTLSQCCLKSRFLTQKQIVDEVIDVRYLSQIVTNISQ